MSDLSDRPASRVQRTPSPEPTRSRRRTAPEQTAAVWAIVAVSSVVGALAPAAPTGWRPADVIYRAAVAGLVPLAASRARRWTWFVLAGVAAVVASGWWWFPAIGALGVATYGAWRRRRSRLIGAAVGALAVQGLLHQSWYGFQGASMLVGVLAVAPVLVSAHRRCRRRQRRTNLIVAGAVAAVLGVFTIGVGVAALQGRQAIQDGADQARAALEAARRGDTTAAESLLAQATESLERGRSSVDAWWASPGRAVPVVAQNTEAIEDVLDQSLELVAGGSGSVSRIGDYQSLQYTSGALDLNRVAEIATPISDAAALVGSTRDELADVERGWLVAPLTNQIDELDDELERAGSDATTAAEVLRVAPDLLGANGPRRYFVAFVTPAEQRGGGGFIGQFAELTATNGRVRLTRSGSTTELQAAAPVGSRRLKGLADYQRTYGSNQPADYPQDLTFSPDFPSDADAISQIYPQSGGRPVDGVISVDPVALAALLRFTGPITVEGIDTPLTADNAADILMRTQYLDDDERGDDNDVLADASRLAFEKLTAGSLPAPETLIDALGPMVHQRRLKLHARRPAEQALFRRIGADGTLPKAGKGDVLSVASQNRGNSKIDAYLRRSIDYQVRLDPATGRVRSVLEVRLRNDAPATGLPRVIIGNNLGRPSGANLLTLLVHTPLQLEAASIEGRRVEVQSGRERGLHAYGITVEVPPRGSRTVRVRLDGGLDLRDGYRLTAVPQPMVQPDTLLARIEVPAGWEARALGGSSTSSTLGPRSVAVRADPFAEVERVRVALSR